MPASFLFYDLETSGLDPKHDRIMQFAAQRTDLNLKSLGEPFNIIVKLTQDILPSPDAILITGITPQKTRTEGITEAEFLRIFNEQIATPETILVGYNTIRFDDEFVRYAHYRNFYDPYEWHWQDRKSRWDLLDVVRMTRALRPQGINWPVDKSGKPSNRLELLTAANKLSHDNAHDALSDVRASIAVAKLIRDKQPKLFDYLLSMRGKREVGQLIERGEPFVYSSGKYPNEYQKTTVAVKVLTVPDKQTTLVYDLRHDPDQFAGRTADQLFELWRYKEDATEPRLPLKAIRPNRCPAVAPLSVLDKASERRLKLDMKAVAENHQKLMNLKEFKQKLLLAAKQMDEEQQSRFADSDNDADAQMYDGFFNEKDRVTIRAIRSSDPDKLAGFAGKLTDKRLKALLPLYKARNYPESLTNEEQAQWEEFRELKLSNVGEQSQTQRFFSRLDELSKRSDLTAQQKYLVEELRLWAESIMPSPDY